jgi:hypothetical protein
MLVLWSGLWRAMAEAWESFEMQAEDVTLFPGLLSIRFATTVPPHLTDPLLRSNSATFCSHVVEMPVFTRAVRFKRPANTLSAVKAARVIRSIKSRYRTQAFLFLAYHFFLTSFVHLDIFILFFILVSNSMNHDQAFTSQLLLDGLRFLLDERRFMLL